MLEFLFSSRNISIGSNGCMMYRKLLFIFILPSFSSSITMRPNIATKYSIPTQIANFMGPTWGPPGSCRPQMGHMLAPRTFYQGTGTVFFPVYSKTNNGAIDVLVWDVWIMHMCYRLSIYRRTILHIIAHSTIMLKVNFLSHFELTKDTHTSPSLASYECLSRNIWEKWQWDIGSALYMEHV